MAGHRLKVTNGQGVLKKSLRVCPAFQNVCSLCLSEDKHFSLCSLSCCKPSYTHNYSSCLTIMYKAEFHFFFRAWTKLVKPVNQNFGLCQLNTAYPSWGSLRIFILRPLEHFNSSSLSFCNLNAYTLHKHPHCLAWTMPSQTTTGTNQLYSPLCGNSSYTAF